MGASNLLNINMLSIILFLVAVLSIISTTNGFTVTQPPMPFKWPLVGTLPDFLARGGVDRFREIYEVSYSV